MADHRIIAQDKEAALARINAALETLSKGDDKPFESMPTRGRDTNTLQRDQMVWIADTLERIAGVPTVEALEGETNVDEDAQDSSGDADIDKKSTRGKAKGRS